MLKPTFDKEYATLNKEQKRAVDAIGEKPIMVVAGPGTGKTKILTLRIANILNVTDTLPENILALTFTEAGASNMRKRLVGLIGQRGYRVVIKTFHSFCNDIIDTYPEYFEQIIGSTPLTDVESFSILEEIITSTEFQYLKPWGDPLLYIKDIIKNISELKKESLIPEDFLKLVEKERSMFESREDLVHEKGVYKGKVKKEVVDYRKKIVKNFELGQIYKRYQEELHKRRLFDYSDMIMEVLKVLEKGGDLKLILQETHQHILVDEHQDTNTAQNKIIELICDFHHNPNLFVVGDPKQTIFRFQGASLENFKYFKKIYPDAEIIDLQINYRSSENIVHSAEDILTSNVPLRGNKTGHNHLIDILEFSNRSVEEYAIAQKIKELVEHGVEEKEIAVLYRENKDSFSIDTALRKIGLKTVIESDEDLFSEIGVKKFLSLVEAVYHYGVDAFLAPALHVDIFNIDPLITYGLIHKSYKEKTPLYSLVEKSEDPNIKKLSEHLKQWNALSHDTHLMEFLEHILYESGLLNALVTSGDAEAFLGIEKLFNEAKKISQKSDAELKDFINFIDLVREHNIFIKKNKNNVIRGVRLMTVHRSKGLEFQYVFIINATEKAFGHKKQADKLPLLSTVYKRSEDDLDIENNASMEDERRLFYVALTRAKEKIHISYSITNNDGKETLPTNFIDEIKPERKEIVSSEAVEKKVKENPELLFKPVLNKIKTKLDSDFVSELFHSHPLSVSALNNYLLCPWKYFYVNLLRIPSIQAKHQIYGSAMHHAVEQFWKHIKERGADKEFLLDSYEKSLSSYGVLSNMEYKEALEKGRKYLSIWFDKTNPNITNPVIVEYSIPGVDVFPNISITGKLDKVEWVGDKKVIVTDYKTGKPHTRNYIEGKTQDSNGDMKRQLVFYKILLDLHDNIDMKEGTLEFLQSDEKTEEIKKEIFDITTDEVSELKDTIKKVAEEITTLAFWDKTCDDKTCEYCGFRNLLK